MMKILVYPAWDEASHDAIARAAPQATVLAAADEGEALAQIDAAEILFGKAPPKLLARAGALKWIQAPVAGLEHYISEALQDHPAVLTNMRGIYSDHIADHAMAFLLAFARDLPRLWRLQQDRHWAAPAELSVTHLPETALGIIGFGGIGQALARRARRSGMRILALDPAVSEPAAPVDQLLRPAQLPQLLQEADFVAVCAPHTPDTEGLIGRAELALMKPNAVLINISRGVIVRLGALTEALQERRIAGAALDVFEEEPLPADHPLWELPNVIITPHVADMGPDHRARRLDLFLENLSRYVAGKPLFNVVDKHHFYVRRGGRYDVEKA